MKRAFLPFLFQPSFAVAESLGADAPKVAVLALRAILRNKKSIEIAHQQIEFRGQHFAFSSHVTQSGELILDLDRGDPRLGDRIVLEVELREAQRQVRGIAPSYRTRR